MVERRNILKVRHQYPADWTFDEYGVIDTRLYSGGQIIERKIFGSENADVREKAKALSPYAA